MFSTAARSCSSFCNTPRRFLGLCLLLAAFMQTTMASAFDTVILDPGHGAHDRGAAIGYVYEKHLALDTARRVEQLLKKKASR